MKRFRFPLRPVLVIRAHQESRTKELYRSACSAVAEAEQRRAASQDRLRRLAEAIAEHRRLRFSPLQAAATCRAYGLEGQVAARAEQELQQATAEMRRARSAYVAAHRGLRVVQRLEDKARTGHASACRLAEQAQLDELASLRRDHPVSWP